MTRKSLLIASIGTAVAMLVLAIVVGTSLPEHMPLPIH